MATIDGYGVTDAGFVKKRLPEIQTSIQTALQNGLLVKVKNIPQSVFGELIDTFSDRESAIWEECEALYNAMYPLTATGASLDLAVSFAGVKRLLEASTIVDCICLGTEGTPLAIGQEIQVPNTSETFSNQAPITITANNAIEVYVQVEAVTVGATYSVNINGSVFSYVAVLSDTIASILAALVIALNASGLPVSSDGATLTISSIDGSTAFTCAVSTTLTIAEIGTVGRFFADNTGAIPAPDGQVTQINTPVSGWLGVTNPADGTEGRDEETDTELRARYTSGVYILGAGTVDAIEANVSQNVVGVTACLVIPNNGDTVVNGQPPHSIQVIVQGGSVLDIATEILRVGGAGIATFGSISQTVLDSQGQPHVISFNRPTPLYVWLAATVTPFSDGDEIYPSNGPTAVQGALVKQGSALGIGGDVIRGRLLSPMFADTPVVPGISSVSLLTYSTTNPAYTPVPGDYAAGNINVASTQLAAFSTARTTVA
jgi:uncharacterized phage protein gp47/JayE